VAVVPAPTPGFHRRRRLGSRLSGSQALYLGHGINVDEYAHVKQHLHVLVAYARPVNMIFLSLFRNRGEFRFVGETVSMCAPAFPRLLISRG